MHLKSIVRASIVALASIFASNVQAQSFAFKSGESAEVGDLYWVVNCMSQLTSPPEVTIMDGPPGVTASVAEAMVIPRFQQCAKPVPGAKLKLSVGKIQDYSQSTLTVRVKYQTKDGERQRNILRHLPYMDE